MAAQREVVKRQAAHHQQIHNARIAREASEIEARRTAPDR
jgi:hypothetical protein